MYLIDLTAKTAGGGVEIKKLPLAYITDPSAGNSF